MKLKRKLVRKLARSALKEDAAYRDITSRALEAGGFFVRADIKARQEGVVCGTGIVREVFRLLYADTETITEKTDSETVRPGDTVMAIRAPVEVLLSGERTALNFLSHLSGISTLVRRYVEEVSRVNPGCLVYDTRKTLPGLRLPQKYAVICGGGKSHRGCLAEQVLIKENHLTACGISAGEAVRKAKSSIIGSLVEIEVENMKELEEALSAGADIIMLDNFRIEDIEKACKTARKKNPCVIIEASGGVTLETAPRIASAGVDRISIGGLTTSAPALDFTLLIRKNA